MKRWDRRIALSDHLSMISYSRSCDQWSVIRLNHCLTRQALNITYRSSLFQMRLWAFLSLTVCLLAAQAQAGSNSTNRRTKRQFEADRCDPSYCKIPVSLFFFVSGSPLSWLSGLMRKVLTKLEGKLSHICLWSENRERHFVIVTQLNKLEMIMTGPTSRLSSPGLEGATPVSHL